MFCLYGQADYIMNYLQVPVPLPLISGLSSIRIAIPSDLRPPEARQTVLLAVQELGKHYPQGLPKLHPVKVFFKVQTVSFYILSANCCFCYSCN